MSGITASSPDCPRGRSDCRALSNIITESGETYICCGLNNGTNRVYEQDVFRLCIVAGEVDTIQDCDRRDLIHQMSVVSTALAIAEETE